MRSVSTLTVNRPNLVKGPTKYGGVYTATLIPGDGIGKEITDSVKEIFDRLNVPVEWEQYDLSVARTLTSPCSSRRWTVCVATRSA